MQNHDTARTGLHRTTGGVLQTNLPIRSLTSQQDGAPQPRLEHDRGSDPQLGKGASTSPIVIDLGQDADDDDPVVDRKERSTRHRFGPGPFLGGLPFLPSANATAVNDKVEDEAMQ